MTIAGVNEPAAIIMSSDVEDQLLQTESLGVSNPPLHAWRSTRALVSLAVAGLASMVFAGVVMSTAMRHSRRREQPVMVGLAHGLQKERGRSWWDAGHYLPDLKLEGEHHKQSEQILILAQAAGVVYNVDPKYWDNLEAQFDLSIELKTKYDININICGPPPNMTLNDYKPGWCAFRAKQGQQTIFAIKGSSNDADYGVDLNVVLGGQDPKDIVDFLGEKIREEQRAGYAVIVTGHSLGGYLADIVATTYDLPGMSFCGPGPAGRASTHNGPYLPYDFYILNAVEDPLGNVGWPRQFHFKPPVWMEGSNKDHGIASMIENIKDISTWREITTQTFILYISECSSVLRCRDDKSYELIKSATPRLPGPIVTKISVMLFNATIGKNLDPYLGGGLSDPYVILADPEGQKYTWKTCNDDHSPVWNERKTVRTTLHEDSMLQFEVWDYDYDYDDLLGSAQIHQAKFFNHDFSGNLDFDGGRIYIKIEVMK